MQLQTVSKTASRLGRLLGCVTLLAAFHANALGAPDATGTGWRYNDLDLNIQVLPEEGRIIGEGTALMRYEGDSSWGPFLVLSSNRGSEPVLTFTGVQVDRPAETQLNHPFKRVPPARLAEIRLAEPVGHGAELEVKFEFESRGRDFQFVVSEKAAAASWTHAWYPFPAPTPEDSVTEVGRSTGTTRFDLPVGWRSVSNGRLASRETSGGRAIETWEVTQPVLRSFAAAPYQLERQRVGHMDVGVYLLSPKRTPVREQAVILSRAIGAMVDRFGPYPYPSYNIAEIPEGLVHWYASSEQGFIMAKSSAFDYEGGNLPLFAHEAAHGWWGNLVNTAEGPGSILCSESLAQYSAVVAIESLEGAAAATEFLRFSREGYSSKQCAKGYFTMAAQEQDKPLSQLGAGGWEHNLSDAKGHWVYHMLRRRVGDDVFFGTLRTVIRNFAGKRLRLDDLRSAFILAAPDKGLAKFFSQWLDRKGAPVLDVEFARNAKAPDSAADLTIRQAHEGELYHLFVELEIEGEKGARLETVEVLERETRLTLPCEGGVKAVRLDPYHRLLIWKPEYGPRPRA